MTMPSLNPLAHQGILLAILLLLSACSQPVETIREIEGTFGRAAFAGEAKVQRIGALIAEVIDDATLAQLIEG